MDAHDLTAFRKHLRVYIGVFVALLVGTLLTVGVSYVHFGRADSHTGNIAVALVIAVAKAFLVAAFFMHLISEKRSIFVVLMYTAVFFAGLMALTVWSLQDLPDMATFHRPGPDAVSPPQAH